METKTLKHTDGLSGVLYNPQESLLGPYGGSQKTHCIELKK